MAEIFYEGVDNCGDKQPWPDKAGKEGPYVPVVVRGPALFFTHHSIYKCAFEEVQWEYVGTNKHCPDCGLLGYEMQKAT